MGIIAANSEYVIAAKALVTPARRIETTIAGPAPTWPESPEIAVPMAAKIPPDDRADAERGELEGTERALEPTADLAVGDALVDGLATEELRARQRAAPAPA